jgi:hypothetical protein
MTEQQSKVLSVIAINTVLQKLGEQIGTNMLDVLKSFLMRELNGKIVVNNGLSCSLEELRKALQSIVGKDAADMFLQDVYLEIDRLSEKLTRRGEIISS